MKVVVGDNFFVGIHARLDGPVVTRLVYSVKELGVVGTSGPAMTGIVGGAGGAARHSPSSSYAS